MWILVSFLLKKPADLYDPFTMFSFKFISDFILFLKSLCMVIKKVRDKLGCLFII